MSYFPMMVELENQHCLVVGGGKIALRKVMVLQEFGADIHLIAPEIIPELKAVMDIQYEKRVFEDSDVDGMALVVAASNDAELNHRVAQCCHLQKIPVNAVDQLDDCSFIFPSYLKQGEVVAAFSSGGKSPVITQYLKEKNRPAVTEQLGELAECLGSLRETVKQCVESMQSRKNVYQELLQLGLERDIIPSKEEIAAVIKKYADGCDRKEVVDGTDKTAADKCSLTEYGQGEPCED